MCSHPDPTQAHSYKVSGLCRFEIGWLSPVAKKIDVGHVHKKMSLEDRLVKGCARLCQAVGFAPLGSGARGNRRSSLLCA